MSQRRRLDAELVRRGLAAEKEAAQLLVAAGRVTVGGAPAPNPARMVAAGDSIQLLAPPKRYVSRGGLKLEAALAAFALDVTGRRCLDAGASTGGFTDCLLQHGASEVVAIDVGYGQLHERMRTHPHVHSMERVNVRALDQHEVGAPFSCVVADLSFISLRTVAASLLAVCEPGADLVVLVKPQFEAEHAIVSRGNGIVTDPAVWRRTVDDVIDVFSILGAQARGEVQSPLKGARGNTEFLLWLQAAATTSMTSAAVHTP